MSNARRHVVRRVGIAILIANVLLAAIKIAVWWLSGSLAVGSEAVNSVADSLYSVVIVGGLYLTTRPPDFEHPHGHERIEPFISLFIAVGIFIAAGGVLWNAVQTIQTGSVVVFANGLAIGVLVVSALVKYGLYRYCRRIGEERQSPAVTAAALDNRNDILTAAAALIGVVGAAVGFPLLDPIAAGTVSIGIFYTGYEIVKDNVSYLVGAAPPEPLRRKILQCALSHPQVEGAHDVVAHYVGPEVDVSLHIEVEGDLTLSEAHEIESAIVGDIMDIPAIDDVFVHVDPKSLGEWKSTDKPADLQHVTVDSQWQPESPSEADDPSQRE
ncbi:MAG: putative Co/Zn/Cd cation transporter [Haloquadratum sp. J07HQX50]|nr:MAG: putative Co/Zn/Cd cation transporter [Haloquadratum sp. J07HQX50]